MQHIIVRLIDRLARQDRNAKATVKSTARVTRFNPVTVAFFTMESVKRRLPLCAPVSHKRYFVMMTK